MIHSGWSCWTDGSRKKRGGERNVAIYFATKGPEMGMGMCKTRRCKSQLLFVHVKKLFISRPRHAHLHSSTSVER